MNAEVIPTNETEIIMLFAVSSRALLKRHEEVFLGGLREVINFWYTLQDLWVFEKPENLSEKIQFGTPVVPARNHLLSVASLTGNK